MIFLSEKEKKIDEVGFSSEFKKFLAFERGPYPLPPEKCHRDKCAGCKQKKQLTDYYVDISGNPRKICDECRWKLEKGNSIDEMFNSKPLSFNALNLKDGPHQLVGEMYHQGICYKCKQTTQISWYYSDFKGEKHELCTECGWVVSRELGKGVD